MNTYSQDLSALVTQITQLQNMTGQMQNPSAHQQGMNMMHTYVHEPQIHARAACTQNIVYHLQPHLTYVTPFAKRCYCVRTAVINRISITGTTGDLEYL